MFDDTRSARLSRAFGGAANSKAAQDFQSAGRLVGVILAVASCAALVAFLGADRGAIPRLELYVPPEFPAEARSQGISGTVILEVTISPNGYVEDVRVKKGVNFLLDQSAVHAVRQWVYEPLGKETTWQLPVAFEVVGK